MIAIRLYPTDAGRGTQPRFPPYPMHHVLAHVDRRGQLAATPMTGTVFRLSTCRGQDLRSKGSSEAREMAGSVGELIHL
jgi:hypothetical protein